VNHTFLILALLFLFISTSCDDNQHIRHYRIEKDSTPKISNKQTSITSDINWTSPSNWISSKGSSMRIGSFMVPYSNGEGDLSVIKLGGTAGGLAPNINRWRGQLNLEPHTEEDIQKYIQMGESPMGSFQWLTILNSKNDKTAFIVSIFQTRTHTIFVKLSASQSGISELEKEFLNFCKSFIMGPSK
tara:strand:- start:121 stop:681 length:561 start_codon:yes stop_codon:yes gene_type:complete